MIAPQPGWSAASADEWMALVRQSLRGQDLAELASTTRDGIEIRPLYTDPKLALPTSCRHP